MFIRSPDSPIACKAEFDVIAESGEWIVISKAAPLIVHPANGRIEPNLLQGLQQLLCYELANGKQLSLVNRLDRETSGLSLIAKTLPAARELGKAMQRREMHKEYLAIVHGHPAWNNKTCDGPITRKGEVEPSSIWVKQFVHESGKECRTDLVLTEKFLKNGEPFSLIRCVPHTGRMHQIRVHLSHLGHPIVGDKIYGFDENHYLDFIEHGWNDNMLDSLLLHRHALHASKLHFPFQGETVKTQAALPEDMARFLNGMEAL